MQRRQQSLFSFFANNATSNVSRRQVSERDSNDDTHEKPLHDQTTERPQNIRNNFDTLKNKFLRPQKILSSENNHRVLQSADTDTSFNPSISRIRSEQALRETSYPAEDDDEKFLASRVRPKQSDAAQEVEDGEHDNNRIASRRTPHALGCRPSIPGIKRIQEDHDTSLQDESCASPLLKRRKLLEAIGDGELHRGLWDEAKSKFEWLNSSNIRDGNGRKPGHPHYDKRTVQIPNDVLNKMSASQKQYWGTKCHYMDTLIFFKVGKFYELYELDAEIGNKELNWKLTVSGVGKCRQVGVSESGIEDAVQKFLTRGYKVGRIEQTETAEEAKAKRGPHATIQRKLTHVLTPATAMNENMKPEAVHLLAIREESENSSSSCSMDGGVKNATFGFAFVDAAACRFYVGSLHDDNSRSALGALLTQVAPQELLYEHGGLSEETMKAFRRYSYQGFLPLELTPLQPNAEFIEASAAIKLIQSSGYFGQSIDNKDQCSSGQMNRWLDALNAVNDFNSAAVALGALVLHLRRMKLDEELLKEGLLAPYKVYGGSLRLDGQTLSNLEIFKNNADGGKSGTLLCFLDNCSTSFGKRLLHRWMCHPLQKVGEINDRLDAVEELRCHPDLVGMLRSGLRQLPDLERLLACLRRLVGSSHLAAIALVWNRIQRQKVKAFCSAVKGLLCAFDLLRSVSKGNQEGPLRTRLLQTLSELEGKTEAYELLVTINLDIETWCSSRKGQASKQDQGMNDKDCDLLNQLLMFFNKQNGCWLLIIENLSQIDVLVSFCVSTDGANGPTCRPKFVSNFSTAKGGAVLKIKGLWHPFAAGGHCGIFVRNDVELGCDTNPSRAMLLTGPNMGGKSTLLRATCLAVILAQLGCYVPAESCIMSPVDIIFTRLGSSDRIMSGESTFMVECMEASSVLRYATGNSLVILDELGRGTSTFDGYAIAYAVFRHLVDNINCRLLFATHYHPLTKEFAAHPSVIIQHMSCAFQSKTGSKCVEIKQTSSRGIETGELSDCYPEDSSICEKRLVFLYKLSSGASPDSYGLHAALLAGMPITVVKRAEQARSIIQSRLSSTFESTSFREQFSHAHDEWLRTILSIPKLKASNCSSFDVEDAYDTLVCVRHEVQSSMNNGRTKS